MEILVDSASACAGQGAECGFFAKETAAHKSVGVGALDDPQLYRSICAFPSGGEVDETRCVSRSFPVGKTSRRMRCPACAGQAAECGFFCKGNGSDPYRLVQKTHKPVGATIGRPFSHPVRRATNGRPYGIVGAAQTPSCAGCLPLPTYTKAPPLACERGYLCVLAFLISLQR